MVACVGASFALQRVLRCCAKPQAVFGLCGFLSGFYLQIEGKGSGPDETRTRDLRHARAALSRLSYGPWKLQQS
jgi:hypothetical protein